MEQPASSLAEFRPVVARTMTIHRPVDPIAFDCVQMAFIRSGSAIVYSEFGARPVKVGDVVLLARHTLCGCEPEFGVTVTFLFLDKDYLVDQVLWQYAAILTDRWQAEEFIDTRYAEPAQVASLGEDRVGYLMPWLDELVELSLVGPEPEQFFRLQSLVFAVLHVILPYVAVTEARVSPTQRATVYPAPPRRRRFAPLRPEARQAAALLRESVDRRWMLDDLASAVHLSSSHLNRVFVEAFGKSPLAYLTMLRAQKMASLLRTSDLPVHVVARKVGWNDPDYAGRQFRRCVGVSPRRYRMLTRQGRTNGGPGRFAHES